MRWTNWLACRELFLIEPQALVEGMDRAEVARGTDSLKEWMPAMMLVKSCAMPRVSTARVSFQAAVESRFSAMVWRVTSSQTTS